MGRTSLCIEGAIMEAEYNRIQVDPWAASYAEVRFQQKIAAEVVGRTIKLDNDFQQQALQTRYEQNFSRVNLLA